MDLKFSLTLFSPPVISPAFLAGTPGGSHPRATEGRDGNPGLSHTGSSVGGVWHVAAEGMTPCGLLLILLHVSLSPLPGCPQHRAPIMQRDPAQAKLCRSLHALDTEGKPVTARSFLKTSIP